MNFIVSLAHFCEVHGPTSILCTQVIPPDCPICDPLSNSSIDAASPPKTPTPPASQSEDAQFNGLLGSQASTPQPPPLRGTSSNPASYLSSPMETPPASPRSPVMSSSSLPSSASGPGIGIAGVPGISAGASSSSTETCKNCSLSLPKTMSEKIQESALDSARAYSKNPAKAPPPILRTREMIPVYNLGEIGHFGPGWHEDSIKDRPEHTKVTERTDRLPVGDASNPSGSQPAPQPSLANFPPRSSASSALSTEDEDFAMDTEPPDAVPSTGSITATQAGSAPHNHHITYLSTRAPSTPSRFSALRQSCIRSLSCELLPAYTGPVFFGDSLAGFTIAYVFRIADPKARGGKRSYAFLCICPEEKALVRSWKYIVGTFESLVQRIKGFAALKNAKDKQAAAKTNNVSTTSPSGGLSSGRIGGLTGPEGFLRRREGVGSAKGLAELVGKDDLFVEVHATFVRLLGGLVRRYGYFHGKLEPDDPLLPGAHGIGEPVSNSDRVRSRSMAQPRDSPRPLVGMSHRPKQRSLSTDGGLERQSTGIEPAS